MTLKKRLLALCMAVVMVFSLCSISAFAAAPTDDKQPVVIGRYDAPLSECLEPGMAMQVGIANVRVNSYATYDIIKSDKIPFFKRFLRNFPVALLVSKIRDRFLIVRTEEPLWQSLKRPSETKILTSCFGSWKMKSRTAVGRQI